MIALTPRDVIALTPCDVIVRNGHSEQSLNPG